jgi:serine/threonine protein kinase
MFVKEDSFSEVKVVDFGFARHVSSMAVGTAGTLGYKAPEVFEGRPVGPKADMWSIGTKNTVSFLGSFSSLPSFHIQAS